MKLYRFRLLNLKMSAVPEKDLSDLLKLKCSIEESKINLTYSESIDEILKISKEISLNFSNKIDGGLRVH